VTELGVCLGYSKSTPGSYQFFIASGKIVDRRTFDLSAAIPFYFDRRQQPLHASPVLPLAPAPAPCCPSPQTLLSPSLPLLSYLLQLLPNLLLLAHLAILKRKSFPSLTSSPTLLAIPKKINSVRYYWLHQLINSQLFKDYCVEHPELSHHLVSPPPALPAPQVAPVSLQIDNPPALCSLIANLAFLYQRSFHLWLVIFHALPKLHFLRFV